MKIAVLVFFLLILIGGRAYYYSATDNRSAERASPQESPSVSLREPVAVDVGPSSLPPEVIEPARSEAPKVTAEQRTTVLQQEENLLEMAREYEAVRDDPEQRQALRKQMQQQLAVYSESVLPMAIEELEAAQSKN